MGKEIWKSIENYNYYEVSNTGKVRSTDRYIKNKNGVVVFHKGKMLKARPNSQGYLRVPLKSNDKNKQYFVHRLVAQAFIPNIENKPCINHIDNNPTNNNVKNLEWCTLKENSHWAHIQGRDKRTKQWLERLRKSLSKHEKMVIAENIKTGQIIKFKSVNDVRKKGFQSSCVCNCCKGKRLKHKGYKWRYAN